MLGTIEYMEWVGEAFGEQYTKKYASKYQGRALKLKQAMAAIRAYKYELNRALQDVLEETPSVTVYGPTDQSYASLKINSGWRSAYRQ